MKNRTKVVFKLLFCLLFSSFFVLKAMTVQAEEDMKVEDCFAVVAPDGSISTGSIFNPDKPTIKAVYQGDFPLADIKKNDGALYFGKYSTPIKYGAGTYFYYNNMGKYNNRSLSLEISHITGGSGMNADFFKNQVFVGGGLSQTFISGDKAAGYGTTSYQLVYTDTKTPVENIYVELSNLIINENYRNPNGTFGFDSIGVEGIKKVYLQTYDNSSLVFNGAYIDTGNSSDFNSRTTLRTTHQKTGKGVSQNLYTYVFDNKNPLVIGTYSPSNNYISHMLLYDPSIKSIGEPIYTSPTVEGKKTESFTASYTVRQNLINTYSKNFPSSLSVILEDKEKVFTSLDSTRVQLFNNKDTEITSQVNIESIGSNKLKITLPKTLLEELGTNTIRMEVSVDKINISKAISLFNSTTGTVKLPLTTYNITQRQTDIQSESSEASAEVTPAISATPVDTKTILGSSTKDLKINKLLKDTVSNIPGDKVKVVGLVAEKVFDRARREYIDVKIQSELIPQLTKIISVPVTVVDEIVKASFFENQAWIVDEIEYQLRPKTMNRDLYLSDLIKITEIALFPKEDEYKGQLVPKNIRYLRNLESLRVLDGKMVGVLPKELGELTKLKQLRINGNTFTGEIPESLGNLSELEILIISHNELTGTVPEVLTKLPKLSILFLNNNKLVGQLPKFKDNMTSFYIHNNQITHNSNKVPSFIQSTENNQTTTTFLEDLSLNGNKEINLKGSNLTVRPFDSTSSTYFNLHAVANGTTESLYDDHIYTIKNQDGIVYEGKANKNVSFPHKKGSVYTAILDQADQNPNNVLTIKTINDDLITSAFFENQSWIINNLNDQLKPKKIDVDVYPEDLDKIKQVNTDSKRPFNGQHIPKNINALKNLELLHLRNTKMSGSLPVELGDLTKMKDLRIFDNSFTGGIPDSLTKLKNIEYLYLDGNGLTGTIPTGLETLPKLHSLYLDDNKLVGQVPAFGENFKILQLGNTQLTYNAEKVPSFMESATNLGIGNTFISSLSLKGNEKIEIKAGEPTIRPFDSESTSYFNLHALKGSNAEQLYDDHIYTIKTQNGVVYEGKAGKNVSFQHKKGAIYTVILDKADKNPKNVFKVTPVEIAVITSAFFENQSWIIDNINDQLKPQKIDVDVYPEDLEKITQIHTDAKRPFKGQHIPKNIKALKNLEVLYLSNAEISGSLPVELGELTKMKDLRVFDNSLTGEIPESLGNLKELRYLLVSNNLLTGTVPEVLTTLPNMHSIYLNGNKFVGQLPKFRDNMLTFYSHNNQITYNSNEVPSFIQSAQHNMITSTFIAGLSLNGNEKINIKEGESTIRPFDSASSSYFNLHALKGANVEQLYDDHIYTIKTQNGVVYEGKADKNVSFQHEKGAVYTVILDKADKNPKNVFKVTPVEIAIITSAFFENQSWIINNINDQLKPKKIDVDVYPEDLEKIKQVNTDAKRPFNGQHIPKNINALKNLELLYLRNTLMTGSLPKELGSLTKMKDLRIFNNTFTGGIPESFTNLKEVENLILDENGLTGTIPSGLGALPKLNSLYLDKNKLVGQIPDFGENFKTIQVGNTQLTYNAEKVPSFMESATNLGIAETFISTLSLKGNGQIQVQAGYTISPFDKSANSYFDLHAYSATKGKQSLYDDHIYTIKNKDEIVYEGKANENVSFTHKSGANYTVILDKAEQNPKNVFTIKSVESDLVTSNFFENQSWIINNINDQLKPKKIDVDVYMSDLEKIKQVNTDAKRPFNGQHIPKNINALKNLELLYLRNTLMTGSLPKELGSLTKMKDLRIFNNTFTGGIPESFTNLKEVENLILDENGLTGTIPSGLGALPKLNSLYLEKNKLVGQIPDFGENFKTIQVGNTQLTYNAEKVPSFMESATNLGIGNTFISGLSLQGNKAIDIKAGELTIRPFDSASSSYFNLHAQKGANVEQLYDDHIYTIKTQEGVVYEGAADKNVSFQHKKGADYTVILDKADKNPKNVFKVTPVELEVITSEFFENQSWIIDEVNKQLNPKQIDQDVYLSDLAEITTIDTGMSSKGTKGQFIPKNIDALTNLIDLILMEAKMVGSLPTELGNLTKLKNLKLMGNTFTGGIPESFGNLSELRQLYLVNSNLTGTIPEELAALPNLEWMALIANKFVGQVPTFRENMKALYINNTQLTYNSAQVPNFITSAENFDYKTTFIEGLTLKGKDSLTVKAHDPVIRPFDSVSPTYFDLHATQTEGKSQTLYDEHIYTIKNQEGMVLYEGKADENVEIPHKKETTYTVVLDKADQNPNNIVKIRSVDIEPVKSEFFENQSWIIGNINDQLQPKKIDHDVYLSDLEEITVINTGSNSTVTEGQFIPKNISALKNLKILLLSNAKMSGKLPKELGDLTNMQDLRIFGNNFTGGIPESLENLSEMETLLLSNNGLTGTIPEGLAKLSKLHTLFLNGNQLVGQLPKLREKMKILSINNNQITDNSNEIPSYIHSATTAIFTSTFISTLSLQGNETIEIKEGEPTIRPFDSEVSSYFNLHALNGENVEQLYDDHIYTIKTQEGVVYEGKADKNVSFQHKKGAIYTVILDQADKNPKNVFKVTPVELEIITSEFFENQSWIINEINKQLKPKQIDQDVYLSDLAAITLINPGFPSKVTEGQRVPKNIDALKNLTDLLLMDAKMVGSLPKELGNLTKLKDLRIYGNTFTGEIPESLGNLSNLETLYIINNGLTGTIPEGLAALPKLSWLSVAHNKLVGQVPTFRDNMKGFTINYNQLTYNSAQVPSFLTSADLSDYQETFVEGLTLRGSEVINIKADESVIRPFDAKSSSYFLLHVYSATGKPQLLHNDHIYTIKNPEGTILYEGKADKNVEIPHKKGTTYTVVLDKADQNPNNVITVNSKIPELKLNSIPDKLSFSISSKSEERNPVKPIGGHASVFDNRGKGNWQLSILPSELVSGKRKLLGEYHYVNDKGTGNSIVTGQKVLIESGASDEANEVTPISEKWTDEQGLHYTVNQSNYLGNYKGSVTWILEDVPKQ